MFSRVIAAAGIEEDPGGDITSRVGEFNVAEAALEAVERGLSPGHRARGRVVSGGGFS